MLAACGSNADMTPASAINKVSSSVAAPASTCPSAMPQSGGIPEWTLRGATGSVSITGPTATGAPLVKVDAPFSVTQTQVHTVQVGDGPVVTPPASVSWCVMTVNGRTGLVDFIGSSYDREEGGVTLVGSGRGVIQLTIDPEIPLPKLLVGQKVGSTVAIAWAPAAGETDAPQPSGGRRAGDTTISVINILGVTPCISYDDPQC